MSLQEITERVHSLGNAWEHFKSVNDARLSEVERKGYADPLYNEHLGRINESLDQHKRRIDMIETANARPERDAVAQRLGNYDVSEYRSAFRNYLRKGMDAGLEKMQLKALSVGTDTEGGFLVPNQMSELLTQIVFESSPMRKLATIETISSDTLDLIDDTGEMTAEWATETAARNETNNPLFGRTQIETFEMHAQPKATQKLIDDASIDIESWIARKVAEKFSRLEATAFISGDGVGKPKGILAYAAGTAWGQIEQLNSGTSAVITADSLIRLYYALKDEYAKQASFLMHRTSAQAVRLLKEATTNQYLWQPGLAAGAPDTLMGVPVVLASDVPAPAASSLSVVVGDFKRAYLIVDRLGIRTLRDPYTSKPFVKFYTTRRVGGAVVNSDAVKILKLAV